MPMTLTEALQARYSAAEAGMGFPEMNDEQREAMRLEGDLLYEMLSGKRRGLKMREAITVKDFPKLLKVVLDNRVLQATEPAYIAQTLLSKTIPVGSRTGQQIRIPHFDHVEASEIGEGMLFPEITGALNWEDATTILIRKFGIAFSITEEAMDADEMGLWMLHIDEGRRAMRRLKENELFTLFKTIVEPAFDNVRAWGDSFLTTTGALGTPTDATLNTHGLGADGTYNGTMHVFDVIDVLALQMSRGYTPTDWLMNPLAWAILARNPVLNGFYLNQRAMPAQVVQAPMYKATGPQDIPSVPLPWNLNLHVSDFVPVNYLETGDAPFVTDMYIGSRNDGLVVLQGSPLEQESYSDIPRDILTVRLKERYGVGILNGGRSWASMKNIRIDNSYEYVTTKLVS